MSSILVGLVWLVGLGTALYASEKLVHFLTELGAEIYLPVGLLGLLVACGADAPEVTSALIATARGSSDVGVGVILGSNIYNLAGLLGLSAIIVHGIRTTPYRLVVDGGANVLLTLGLVGIVLAPGLHLFLGSLLLLILLGYVLLVTLPRERVLGSLPRLLETRLHEGDPNQPSFPIEPARRFAMTVGLVILSAAFIVIGSDLLVNTSLTLGAKLGLSSGVIGTFVLAIATSLPNTWAAISLARRGFGGAAIATTFSSNSINAALGAGLPALVAPLHLTGAARWVDALWLLGMTALAIALLAARRPAPRHLGIMLVCGYVAFAVIYIVTLR